MPPHQTIIIVGCGRLGSILANQLSSQGSSVVVIDIDESAFEKLSTEFSGFTVTGDAAELAILRRAKVGQATRLLAVTRHDNVNLMVAQVARTVFGVPQVLARIFDPARQQVYNQLGIQTICPTSLSADVLLKALSSSPQQPKATGEARPEPALPALATDEGNAARGPSNQTEEGQK